MKSKFTIGQVVIYHGVGNLGYGAFTSDKAAIVTRVVEEGQRAELKVLESGNERYVYSDYGTGMGDFEAVK